MNNNQHPLVEEAMTAHDLTSFTAETLDGPMRIEVVHRANNLMVVLNGTGYLLPAERKVLMNIVAADRTVLTVDAKVLD